MTPQKLDVLVGLLCYSGNGSTPTLSPDIAMWWGETRAKILADPGVGRLAVQRFGDTPLTMERNRMVKTAKEGGFDVLLMVDSDMKPDLYVGVDPDAKPFWESSFAFLHKRSLRGLPTVVCAPYCGPPPNPIHGGEENVYVFRFSNSETDSDNPEVRLEAYSRGEAALMRGIQPIGAGPTGLAMYTISAFDVMPVGKFSTDEILAMVANQEMGIVTAKHYLNMNSWFFYEHPDPLATEKASTEDVTNTREIQLAGKNKYGEDIVFCNWDAWAGHWKPKCVGKPRPVYIDQVNEIYREAVLDNLSPPEPERKRERFSPALAEESEPPKEEPRKPVKKPARRKKARVKKARARKPAKTSSPKPKTSPIDGVPIKSRMFNGRKLTSVGHRTSDEDLTALANVVQFMAQENPDRALRIVEVGSWVGESAVAMASVLGPAGGVIYCVETFEGTRSDPTSDWAELVGKDRLKEHFRQNVGDYMDETIRLYEGRSTDVAAALDPQDLDVIFIDAAHDYESCKRDIEAWLPHLSATGIMVGHDYHRDFPGVQKAVDEFCAAHGLPTRLIGDTPLWMVSNREIAQKTAGAVEG